MSRTLKILICLLACTLAGILLVFGLFQWSVHGTFKSNNFIRQLPPHMVSNAKWLDLKMNSYYLAGLDSKTIYLCNRTAPAFILKTNYQLSDTTHAILQFSKTIAVYGEGIETIIDSPDIYSMDGLSAVIEHGTLSDYSLDSLKISTSNFNAGLPLTSSSIILRTFDTALKRNILTKSGPGKSIIRAPNLLKKQIDGVFCTDGMLSFDLLRQRIYYIYFYRNQFLCLDTNLNLLSQGKTIDTVTRAHITVAFIPSQDKTTFSSPPLIVNKTACIDGNYLYVHSKLKADNEEANPENKYSDVDIYDLNNGRYMYSFFVPDDNRAAMNNFRVKNGHLVAMFDHSIMVFQLNLPGSN